MAESETQFEVFRKAFAIGAGFSIGLCAIALSPLSYVPFWSPPACTGNAAGKPDRKDPAV